MRDAGLSYFNEDQSTLGFDDPKYLLNYWNRYLTAIEEGWGLDPAKQTRTGDTDVFIQDSWMALVWTNQVQNYITDSGCEIALVQVPQEDDAVAPSNWLKPSQFWSIPSGAQNKELAAEFVSWVTTEGELGGLPVDTNPKAAEVRELVGEVTKGIVLGAETDLKAAADELMKQANALLAEGMQ